MKKFKRVIKDIFSEPDNDTICPVRVLAILGFTIALVLACWNVFMLKVAFVIMEFGGAYAAMLAALGLALGLKADSKEKPNAITVP